MPLQVSRRFMKAWKKLHPRYRGQVASELVRLAAGEPRADWGKFHSRETKLITVGEYRVELERGAEGLWASSLMKRNDNYKP